MTPQPKRPNIVMLVLDSARYDRLGIHGYGRPITPCIDALAAEGLDYTNANSPGGSTRPSMGSNFTGLFPQAYGFADDKFPDEKHTMVAERLRGAGYQTFVYSSNAYVSPATGYTRGFDTVLYLNRGNALRVIRPSVLLRNGLTILKSRLRPDASYSVSSDLLLDEALAALDARGREDPPMFFYIHMDVHHPYLSDRRYLRPLLEAGIDSATIREVEHVQKTEPMMHAFASADIPIEKRRRYWSVLRSMYDASFKKCDDQLAAVFAVLQRRGLYDNSMIVVTSDHGELIGERGDQMDHGMFPYDEVMRIPLVIKYPRELGRRGSTDRLTSTIDLVPTFCELAGIELPDDQTQGISLLGDGEHEFVVQQRQNFHRISFEDFKRRFPHVDLDWLNLGHVVAWKDRRHKFVWTSKGRRFLFDLQNDPGELKDLAATETATLDAYQDRFDAWRDGLQVTVGSAEPEYDAAVMDHLRRLGYVE
jgi:arylsulfatase A-like enzyme